VRLALVRDLGAWFVPQSRDPNAYIIDTSAERLRAAGHQVTVTIEAGHRPTAGVEADNIDRQEQRADHLAEKAQTLQSRYDAADASVRELAYRGAFGQPILIGHHLQRRMERHYPRFW